MLNKQLEKKKKKTPSLSFLSEKIQSEIFSVCPQQRNDSLSIPDGTAEFCSALSILNNEQSIHRVCHIQEGIKHCLSASVNLIPSQFKPGLFLCLLRLGRQWEVVWWDARLVKQEWIGFLCFSSGLECHPGWNPGCCLCEAGALPLSYILSLGLTFFIRRGGMYY